MGVPEEFELIPPAQMDRRKTKPVNKAPMSAHSLERRGFGIPSIRGWPVDAPSWMVASFLIALALAAIAFVVSGAADRGTGLALQVTGRWSFFLFWLAYTGGAIAKLFGSRFDALARRGRELGLAFASAHLVHLGLIFWLYHISTGPDGAMVLFWIGMLCTYLLALFSLPRLRDALGPRFWPIFRTVAVEYIALVFALDFIFGPLRAGDGKYPLSYLPFALMLVGGASLRIAAFARHQINAIRQLVLR